MEIERFQIGCTARQAQMMQKSLRMYIAARENDWGTLCADLIRKPEGPAAMTFDRAQAYDTVLALLKSAGETANRDGYVEDASCKDARSLLTEMNAVIVSDSERIELELLKKDVFLLQEALEEYFRIRYRQSIDFANAICRNGFRFDVDNPQNGKAFRRYIARRNEVCDILDAAWRIAAPWSTTKTKDCCVAEDVWAVIRYRLFQMEFPNGCDFYNVRAYAPVLISGEDPVVLTPILVYPDIE